jgi:acetyl-CoA carboxylase biotin carboxyl carrier protein
LGLSRQDIEREERDLMADETNLENLQALVEFLRANDIAEYESQQGDAKLRIKFAAAAAAAAPGIDAAQLAQLFASAGGANAAVAPIHPHAPSSSHAEPQAAPEAPAHIVKSPIVGTFYDSPSPGSAPFVKIGDIVEVGQVLCIVEAMKLMNEIESDAAGEIVSRIATSGQPVEYGQPLFSIKVI